MLNPIGYAAMRLGHLDTSRVEITSLTISLWLFLVLVGTKQAIDAAQQAELIHTTLVCQALLLQADADNVDSASANLVVVEEVFYKGTRFLSIKRCTAMILEHLGVSNTWGSGLNDLDATQLQLSTRRKYIVAFAPLPEMPQSDNPAFACKPQHSQAKHVCKVEWCRDSHIRSRTR
eukprot:6458266-Amphidinium_carterae.1